MNRPDRKDEPKCFGNLGGLRQWIESVFDTLEGQLSREDHGAPANSTAASPDDYSPSPPRSGNIQIGNTSRSLTAYDH